MKEFEYYEGKDIVCPKLVNKPLMPKGPTADASAFKKYADELEQYEKAKVVYDEQNQAAHEEKYKRRIEFEEDTLKSLGIFNHPKAKMLWRIVIDNDGSLYDRYYFAKELADLIRD